MIANMRYIVTGLLQVAGVVGIVIYARADDDYYGNDHVSHWEHATRGGAAPLAVAATLLASAVALAFLVQGLFSRQLHVGRFAIVLGALYVLSLWFAFVLLSLGH